MCLPTSRATLSRGSLRAAATRPAWYCAAATLISGSSPLADAVTRSTGTGARVARVGRLEGVDAALDRGRQRRIGRPLVGAARSRWRCSASAPVADGRPQK